MIAQLAGRQHGVVGYRQLVEVGLRRGGIEARVRGGRLHRLHRGVYAVGHRALTQRGRWMAAALACGDRAVLSHHAAGVLWGLRPSSRAITDITTPARGRRGSNAIRVHRVRRLDPHDVTVHDGIPVTTVSRTLLDLAEVLQPHQLENAFEQAERLQLLDLLAVQSTCRRNPGRRGLRPLAPLLAQAHPAPDTRSGLERRFLRLCDRFDVSRPNVNVLVAGVLVDAFWPDHRLVVEIDGHAYHRTRAAFERDRVRDAQLQVAGYRVVRVTERRIEREPEAVAGMLTGLMRLRPSAPLSQLAGAGQLGLDLGDRLHLRAVGRVRAWASCRRKAPLGLLGLEGGQTFAGVGATE